MLEYLNVPLFCFWQHSEIKKNKICTRWAFFNLHGEPFHGFFSLVRTLLEKCRIFNNVCRWLFNNKAVEMELNKNRWWEFYNAQKPTTFSWIFNSACCRNHFRQFCRIKNYIGTGPNLETLWRQPSTLPTAPRRASEILMQVCPPRARSIFLHFEKNVWIADH